MVERSKDWLEQALSDLNHARKDLEDGFYDWACFSAQQAAGKAVKAVFQKIGAETWGHSIAGLLEELKKHSAIPGSLIDKALELDKAYIPARYPNAHPAGAPFKLYTRNEGERLVGYAGEIIEFCKSLLSKTQ
ncbi:MAG: HEPN domain-containing protein [Candidatus Brockarchaeota archaeon]|nr:HEPN domain-containing protein [Candidatus Brockarchaeota archaeon]